MSTGLNETTVEEPEENVSSTRLQLDISGEAYQQLQELKAKAQAHTNAEVVRKALALYEWFLNQKQSEFNRLQVTNGEIVKEIEIIL